MTNPLYDALFGIHVGCDAPFLRLGDGRSVTYDAFLRRSAQFAHELAALGLKPGDRLAAQIEKSPDALAIYAACVQAGVIFLPLNTACTPVELGYFVENSGATLVLCDPSRATDVAKSVARIGANIRTLGADGEGSFAQSAASKPFAFDTVGRDIDDLAAILYTSGTTGRSKGAMLSQRNLLSNAQVLKDYWRFSGEDVLLHMLPIFHTHGLFVATNIMLLAGGAMIFLRKFDVAQALRWLPNSTTMMGVPTFYTRLLDEPGFTRDMVGHMRLFISGSAPLLADTHRQFEARTGHRILERYGMTETNMNTSNPYDGERRAGTVGFPLPGVELKITDAKTGSPLGSGEIGQIEVRGPNVFQGYWQMPEKTREELRQDGFFLTGDLGLVDADGYVHIVARSKDLIITGGYNVYPKEVELALDDQPGILESAVVGAPHPDLGEGVVALVVSEEGRTLDLDGIRSALASCLAGYKCPKRIKQVQALPRNAMGKVQKALLRKENADVFFDTDRSA